jgi:hypothetical protein
MPQYGANDLVGPEVDGLPIWQTLARQKPRPDARKPARREWFCRSKLLCFLDFFSWDRETRKKLGCVLGFGMLVAYFARIAAWHSASEPRR